MVESPFVEVQAIEETRELLVTEKTGKPGDRPLVSIKLNRQGKQRGKQSGPLRGPGQKIRP